MKYNKLLICILMVVFSPIIKADSWALLIGVNDYPEIPEIPKLNYAVNDIHHLKNILESAPVYFSADKVLVLANYNATLENIHRAFKEYLSQAKAEDFLFIYFAGHSKYHQENYYWLLHDSSFAEMDRSALSYRQMSYLIQQYLKTQNIFICSNARNTDSALGKPQKSLLDFVNNPSLELCILESCGYNEQNYNKDNHSIFGYFLGSALQGKEYLNRNPDYNSDGIVTVSELTSFLAWSVSFSGFAQHPFALGKSDYALVTKENYLQIIEPTYIEKQELIRIKGFVRSTKSIDKIKVADYFLAPQKKPIASEALKNDRDVYPFSLELNILSLQDSISITTYANNEEVSQFSWDIPRGKLGWHGEWMPLKMKKSSQYGLYEWSVDHSQMVYVPKGKSIFGTNKQQLKEFVDQLSDVHEEIEQLLRLLQDEKQVKSILVHTLQETNHSILKVNDKMEDVSNKLKAMDDVPEIDVMDIPMTTSGQSKFYYQRAQTILAKCYDDLQTAHKKQTEYQNDLAYIKYLQQLSSNIYSIWGQTTEYLDGYYIDIHETTNKQYIQFCNQTARPYPANPWWQDNYIDDSPDFPVVNVSWEDAVAYSFWAQKVLPTEKKWEKAARGVEGNLFPWGNQYPHMDIVNAAVPVFPTEFMQLKQPLFLPNKSISMPQGKSIYGVYHMSGNVWEWCLDTPTYKIKPFDHLHEYKIAKGGSFNSQDCMLYSWFNHPFERQTRKSDLGFRTIAESAEK